MPLYEYECRDHGVFADFDTVANYKNSHVCEKEGCGRLCHRVISRLQRPIIHENGGPRERARKIKEKGLVELGNESPETVARYFSDQRADVEAKEAAEFDNAARELMHELGSDVAEAIVKESVADGGE